MSTLSKNQNRNTTLDLLKLIAAFCVVFVHYKFYGKVGTVVDALSRFAVPLFFITSGYYSYNNTVSKHKAKAIRLIKMFVLVTLLYHCATIAVYLVQGEFAEISAYLASLFNLKQIIKFLCFNNTLSSTHLWFLLALAYSYILHSFATKYKVSNKVLTLYAVAALSLHLILGEYLKLFSINIENIYVRNFALMGYPLFIVGLIIKQHEQKILNIKNSVLIPVFCIGVIDVLVIRYLSDFTEMYLGTLMIVFVLFVVALKYPNIKLSNFMLTLCASNLYIYLYHKFVGFVITKGFLFFEINITESALLTNMVAVAVAILSALLAIVILKIHNKSKKATV